MSFNENPILLFDGVCNLCNRLVQFIIKRDPCGKFKFASLQSEAGQVVLKDMGLPTSDFDSFVYVEKGRVFLKSAAALHVLKALGGGWKFLYFFMILPKPLRNLVYDLVAKNRYRIFGKRSFCMVPDNAIQRRFL
jgi:predicted DCC family thiol-disulfide oxidoreductase YuxK